MRAKYANKIIEWLAQVPVKEMLEYVACNGMLHGAANKIGILRLKQLERLLPQLLRDIASERQMYELTVLKNYDPRVAVRN